MLIFIIWFYIFFLAFIWWFFVIAKIHAYKFKNFSYNIEKMTNIIFILLLILSILWFILIFNFDYKKISVVDKENINQTIHY